MEKTDVKKSKSKKKKVDSDLVAVIFIVSMIVVIALVFSFFRTGNNNIKYTGTKADIERQQKEQTREIIITVGVASAIIVVLCTGYKIKSVRRKKRELEERLRKKKELEEAISRINQKKPEFSDNMYANDLYRRRSQDRYREGIEDEDEFVYERGIRHKYDFNQIDLDDDDLNDELDVEERKYEDIRRKFGGNRSFDDVDDYDDESSHKTSNKLIMLSVIAVILIGIIIAIAVAF